MLRVRHALSCSCRHSGFIRLLAAMVLAVLLSAVTSNVMAQDSAPATSPPAAGANTAEAAPPQKTFLKWLVDASGPFGACIFVESFIMVAVVIMCLMQIRRQNLLPQSFLDEFDKRLIAQDYKSAFDLAKDDESLVARLLVAGMVKLQKGQDVALKAMTELGEDENMAMEHRLSWLALIATTGPMFGLLGTVQGMVNAFNEIASSNTTPKPSELAEGIQLALVTTLEGLTIAIPAMIAYSLLRNHLTRLMFDIGLLTEQLIGRMQPRTSSGGPASATAPADRA